ncbi:MAG: RNA pyrophosphohydrolase [Holosporaceae bacterium]|jgi:putative (di)nucleoside polyphosphate hydrolase|nr:RNA pyrophosphohydrolase [Holosporaceae bacterium]
MLSYRKCVAIILIKDRKVFVGQRGDMQNAWQLPQGGVEKGEDAVQAAKRELFEETNIQSAEFLGMSHAYNYDFPKHIQQVLLRKYGKLNYLGQSVTFVAFSFYGDEAEINLQKPFQEFSDWKWISIEELLRIIVYFKKAPYEEAIKELREKKKILF